MHSSYIHLSCHSYQNGSKNIFFIQELRGKKRNWMKEVVNHTSYYTKYNRRSKVCTKKPILRLWIFKYVFFKNHIIQNKYSYFLKGIEEAKVK